MNLFVIRSNSLSKKCNVAVCLFMIFCGAAAWAQYDSPGSDAIVDDSEYNADSAAQEKADKAIDAVADEAIRAKREEDRHRMKRLGLGVEESKAKSKPLPKKTEKKSKTKSKKKKSKKQ